jgi:hypothetical protein
MAAGFKFPCIRENFCRLSQQTQYWRMRSVRVKPSV